MKIYYVYQYLREDGTPYYIGKGKGDRMYNIHTHRIAVPKDKTRIQVICDNLTNDEASQVEIELIAKYGRKDRGTGILRNMTDGGEGSPGRIVKHSAETKAKISKAMIGIKRSEETKSKIAASRTGEKHYLFGKTQSSESRQKMSETRLNTPPITCPHCLKTGGAGAMKRWHLDNCRHKD